MRRVLLALAGLLVLAPAAPAAERVGTPDRKFFSSGPVIDSGHVVWAVNGRVSTVFAAAPGGRARVIGRFTDPPDTHEAGFGTTATVLAARPQPVVFREVQAVYNEGGYDAGSELHAGDPLVRKEGLVTDAPPFTAACTTPLAGGDGPLVALSIFGRQQPSGGCVSARGLEAVDLRTGARRTMLEGMTVSQPRVAGRYAAVVDQSVLGQARRSIVVVDLVAGRVLYRTRPIQTGGPPDIDVQEDGKAVVVLGGRRTRGGRPVVWFGLGQREGRGLGIRAHSGPVRISGDRVLTVLAGRWPRLALVSLDGDVRPLRGAVGYDFDLDRRWIAWLGTDRGRWGFFRTRAPRR